ncbi:MAG: DUF2726 domain-containing protein [Betaproteobacteria bacterium]|nr:DUF2726 domain-containing protein [Betaproteobacteria bacterium]
MLRSLFWYLLALAPVVAIAYLVWTYRRKSAEKEAASRERLAAVLGSRRREGAAIEKTAGAAGRGLPAPPPSASAAAAMWVARERFLSQPETLLYYALKAGLPDHEIFAHVGLAALVGVGPHMTGYERDQRLRRLAQHEFSFVVCDKSMRAVAAVELNQAAAAAGQDFKAECLKAAGIRLVRLDPAALPRRDEVRALVRGENQ